MAPHAQAEEFISSYTKLMQNDIDLNNFQKILEMKVRDCVYTIKQINHGPFYPG